jgi:hypothetical protein
MDTKKFYNNKGKVCGWLKNGIYYKEVDSRKHKMKIYNAYAVSDDIFKCLVKENCQKIRLREKDTKRIYEVDFSSFWNKAFLKDWDGLQRFLPLKYWVLEDATLKLF